MGELIERTAPAELDRPVLVLALSGWVDAGSAGEVAAAYLEEGLVEPTRVARCDLADLLDLQARRPTIRLLDGVTREVEWPEITFIAGRAGSDVVVCRGPEPSIRWRQLAAEVVELATGLGVRLVVTLGGMPAAVSHRRPVRVLATAGSRSLAQELEPVRLDYVGPTGAQTVLQAALAAAGIDAVGLWAQVPHYLSGTVSPPAARALLSRLREIAAIDFDLRPLDGQAAAYTTQVEETVSSRSDIAELVNQLDAQAGDEIPTGDELVSEIEEFLRGES